MNRYLLIGLGMFWSVNLPAENAVVLESFESGIDSVTLATNTDNRLGSTPPGINFSQHTKTGDYDSNVTDGNKSLKVMLSGKEGFGFDFQIKLSDEASAKVREAVASPDVARYILRYDVIFPPMKDFIYFNNVLNLGDNRDAVLSTGGKQTMSVALDLLTGLPKSGPLTLTIADDFGCKSATFTNTAVYIDNIRLVDTYAPGAKPKVYELQSFEDTNDPIGGVRDFTAWDAGKLIRRVAFSQYTASTTNDIRVTNGRHALEVDNNNPNLWHADFFMPFSNTKLAEVLQLDAPVEERPTPDQLARYTLRWDVTYPDMGIDQWMNLTYSTIDALLPIIQIRQSKEKNERQTYSITLDQVTSWGRWMDYAPVLVFISDGPQQATRIRTYYDNFRLIDTGYVPPAVKTQ